MPALDDDAHAVRRGNVHDFVGDLGREPFLNLQPPCKTIHDPCELAQAEDFLVRDIADVAFAEERKHVVFAQAVDLDVARNDHVVELGLEDRAVDNLSRGHRVAGREKFVGVCYARRRSLKPCNSYS